MTDHEKTKPQTTRGGPLDIQEEHVNPIGSNAGLKGKGVLSDRSRAVDVDTISERVDGDGQHEIQTDTHKITNPGQKGSA